MCIIILVSFVHFWKEKSHLLGHWPCYCIVRTLWHLSQTSLYLYFQYKQYYRKFQAILSLSVLQGGHHTRDDTRASGKAVSPRLSSLNWLFYGWGLGALWWVTLTNWRDIQRELSNWDFFFMFISLILATAQLEFLIFQTIFNILLSKLHLNLQITLHYLHGHQKCMESKYFLNYKPRELGFC